MSLPNFISHPSCQECNLHADCKTPGLPARRLHGDGTESQAVLLIGERPGLIEDKEGQVFSPRAPVGIYTHGFYSKLLQLKCDNPIAIYGTNSVRCKPAPQVNVTESNAKTCTGLYLGDDIRAISTQHESLTILTCGGPASKAVTGQSLGGRLRKQGSPINGVPVFSTFNPGVLLSGRDPALAGPIRSHLGLLIEYLNTGKIATEITVPAWNHEGVECPEPSLLMGGEQWGAEGPVMSLDIETYGAVDGLPEQTVFHPKKSVAVDGCAPGDLVQTVAISWMLKDGTYDSGLWVMPDQVEDLWRFLNTAILHGYCILGQNLPFDMMFMRSAWAQLGRQYYPFEALLARPMLEETGSKLLDCSIARFLYSDVMPEMSLKEMAPLLRVWNYEEEQSLADGFRYSDKWDPELHHYNVVDTIATMECYRRFVKMTRSEQPGTLKFQKYCTDLYSDILWTVIEMDEAGIAMDETKVRRLHDKKTRTLIRLMDRSLVKYDIKLGGTNSEKPLRSVMSAAAESAGLLNDPRLKFTRVRGISIGRENINLVVGALPLTNPHRPVLRMRQGYKKAEKIISSYTSGLLDPKTGLIDGFIYPSWFPCPGRVNDDVGRSGGTKQGRLAAQSPSSPTFPASVRSCYRSRFDGGVILHGDLSQIELRMMALASGDPIMIQEYVDDVDRHLATGLLILGELGKSWASDAYGVSEKWLRRVLLNQSSVTKTWPGIGRWRQLGKTSNFLLGFRGGWHTFQATARRDNRIELAEPFCRAIVAAQSSKYKVFTSWQDAQIEYACSHRRSVMPLTGITRIWGGSSQTIRDTYTTNIVNFPIQWSAATVLLSAQRSIMDEIQSTGLNLNAVVVENIYDAVEVDCPDNEVGPVKAIMKFYLDHPPFYDDLQAHYGREVPIAHEIEVR